MDEKLSSVTFEECNNLIPIDPVHVTIHLKIYTRPDFSPNPNAQQALQNMVDKVNKAINQFKQDVGAIEEGDRNV